MRKYAVKLLDVIAHSPHVKTFRFERPAGFSFAPGQFVMLSCGEVRTPARVPLRRAFSMASSPGEPYLEFCVSLGTSTGLSHHLHGKAKSGDTFSMDGPYGSFTFHRPVAGETVFIAGGTGIAPLRSMLLGLTDEEFSRGVALFFGVRDPQSILYRDELESMARERGLQLTIAVSDVANGKWGGLRGYIADALDAGIADDVARRFYVCGPPPMVKATLEKLQSFGISGERIYREQW